MEIKTDQQNHKLRIINTKDVDIGFFNLLRRLLMKECQFYVFSEIKVNKYCSKIPVDQFKHALRMIPVKGEEKHLLKVKGPKKVVSDDIKKLAEKDNATEITKADDVGDSIECGIPITRLGDGDEIDVELAPIKTNG